MVCFREGTTIFWSDSVVVEAYAAVTTCARDFVSSNAADVHGVVNDVKDDRASVVI